MGSLRSELVEWSRNRPPWQIAVLRRLGRQQPLTRECIADLVDRIVSSDEWTEAPLGLQDLHRPSQGQRRVSLRHIEAKARVNALVPDARMEFPNDGLIIVYGNNGSGKSGFARLLKYVARARHQEAILSNIFVDTESAHQGAEVGFAVDGVEQRAYRWPGEPPSELRQIGYFDDPCGDAYVATGSEVSYRPAEMLLVDGLIQACDDVRNEINRRLGESEQRVDGLPDVSQGGAARQFLDELSESTQPSDLDDACSIPEDAEEMLRELEREEAQLRSSSASEERERLVTLAQHYEAVHQHLSSLTVRLAPSKIQEAIDSHDRAVQLRSAADAMSREAFASEPVSGVGSDTWRVLWNAARAFFDTEAFPGQQFPLDAESCVLCHQRLDDSARDRFRRFEMSINQEIERNASAAESEATHRAESLQAVPVRLANVEAALVHIEEDDPEQALIWRERLDSFDDVVATAGDLPACLANAARACEDDEAGVLHVKADELRARAAEIDAHAYEVRLADARERLQELADSILMNEARTALGRELERMHTRDRLMQARQTTDTNPITLKAKELMTSHIADRAIQQFVKETEQLRLKRITLKHVGRKGELQQRPQFIDAVQEPALARVLSEGEQTALGLAGFFAEAALDDSRSALVLDDPVSSLDHLRRERVAKRLVAFAMDRQVIVFSHNVAFVAELMTAAKDAAVATKEVSVERGPNDRSGVCREGHPWKVKDIKARLRELESGLARIRREKDGWNEEKYEKEASDWAGKLSETWERILRVDVAGQVVNPGTLKVHPQMFRVLVPITSCDNRKLQASYGRVSGWVRRHDKCPEVGYVPPDVDEMERELDLVRKWSKRIRSYANAQV